MKGMKKLLSILMVLTLVLSLGAIAFADEGADKDVTITMSEPKGDATKGTYKAYQLFTLTTTEEVLPNNEGYSYIMNSKYSTYLLAAAKELGATIEDGKENASILKWLEKLDAATVRQFADKVYNSIKSLEPDYTATEGKFEVPQGYYLIFEEGAEGGATSQVMLDTAGRDDITVTTKEEKPSSEKKLKETNDTTGKVTNWQDGADYDIGDMIPYRLSATIPNEHYADYETYYLQFVDDMCKGLGAPQKVKIYWEKDGEQGDITAKFAGPTVVSDPASKYEGGTVYTWTCEDIKAAGVPAGATVYVEYESELTADAVIGGTGNPNDSHIVYSDNPYGEGKSRTPDDKVCVFTFTIEADKVDGNEQPLEGAGFTLLKQIDKSLIPADAHITDITGSEELGDLAKGTYVNYNGNTYVISYAEITGKTSFEFEGQDSGNYVLVETTVPDGYNKADDIVFTVVATYDEDNSNDPQLKDLTCNPSTAKFTCTSADGTVKTTVVNQTGVELPETGGIGTTIFYIVGAVLVAGAVILLVTKKRVSGMEK